MPAIYQKIMDTKKIIYFFICYFIFGALVGYFSFASYPDLLLPAVSHEYTLVVTDPSELVLTRVLYSFFVALAFLSVPFTTYISSSLLKVIRFSMPSLLIMFQIIMIIIATVEIVIYQHFYAESLDVSHMVINFSLPLDAIPYYKIPIIITLLTICSGFLLLPFKSKQ